MKKSNVSADCFNRYSESAGHSSTFLRREKCIFLTQIERPMQPRIETRLANQGTVKEGGLFAQGTSSLLHRSLQQPETADTSFVFLSDFEHADHFLIISGRVFKERTVHLENCNKVLRDILICVKKHRSI